jgi:hypothetical protein
MECDVCAIKNLIYRYAEHMDRGELDKVAGLFAHGRVIGADGEGNESVAEGAAAVEAMYRSFARLYEDDGTPHTQHVTTNVRVELEDDGQRARAHSYAVVFQALGDFPLQPIIGVRYRDRFERADGAWRFTERRIIGRLFGDLSRHLLRPV